MRKKIIIDGQETNYSITSDGKVFNDKTGRELKGTFKRNEYHSVQLTINKKPRNFLVHRLVAEAFCKNPNHYKTVDHIDTNKQNNDYTNLRWVDQDQNNMNRIVTYNFDNKNISKEELDSDNWKPLKQNNNYLISKEGQVINKKTLRVLSGNLRNGYRRININNHTLSVHRVVWETFKGDIPQGMVIDHINGNRSDNRLENLRLVSQSENMINAQEKGHKGQVKIKQYNKDGSFIQEFSSIQKAADAIGVTEPAVKSAALRYGTCKGYFWIREDQDITIEELLEKTVINKPKSNTLGVSKYSKEGDFLGHYNSLTEAAKSIGRDQNSTSSIKRAALAQRLGLGYYWVLDGQNK